MPATTLGVKLDDKTRARLKALGEAKERASHWLIKTAVAEYLDREEQVERERQEDAARWERYETTGRAVHHTKAMTWLDALAKGKRRPCPR